MEGEGRYEHISDRECVLCDSRNESQSRTCTCADIFGEPDINMHQVQQGDFSTSCLNLINFLCVLKRRANSHAKSIYYLCHNFEVSFPWFVLL